jgi:hypothetical protein
MKRARSRSGKRIKLMATFSWIFALAILATTRTRAKELLCGISNEILMADDILLTDSEWNGRWRNLQREISLTAGASTIGMDYEPSPLDLLGDPATLDDTRLTGQLTWREGLDKTWRWDFSAGAYDGFTDYRSMWLDEYYRQLFSAMPGYEDASVGGWNANISGTYEYLPASGMINWSVCWQVDEVAPGYDKIIGQPLIQGLTRYETWRYGLGSEHVLSPRVRFKQDANAFQTTARAWRYAYKAETIWAATDNWALRLGTEVSKEAEFHSGAVSLLVEHDWESLWFAGIMLRAYHDNGQIIDPLLISGSSPPLETFQAQLTLRYSGPSLTMRFAAGPYLTRYAPLEPGTLRFATLYQDRDWLSLQGSLTWRF